MALGDTRAGQLTATAGAVSMILVLTGCSGGGGAPSSGSAGQTTAAFAAQPELKDPDASPSGRMIVPPSPAVPPLLAAPADQSAPANAVAAAQPVAATGGGEGYSAGTAPLGPDGLPSISPGSVPLTPNVGGAAAGAVPPPPKVKGVPQTSSGQPGAEFVSKITGAGSDSDTDMRWAVTGTGGGVSWDDGSGRVLTAFGDTFGGRAAGQHSDQPPAVSGAGINVPVFPAGVPFPALPFVNLTRGAGLGTGFAGDTGTQGPVGQDWRNNTLARSSDHDLSQGMDFDEFVTDGPDHAREILPARKIDGEEIATIPTGGTSIGSTQVMGYSSIRQWGPAPGSWTSNYAGLATSTDDGATWTKSRALFFTNAGPDANFQYLSLVRRDGFVYLFGSPQGRVGGVYVARVPESRITDRGAVEFWNGDAWGRDNRAVPVVTGGVGEPSVMWNDSIQRWVMISTDPLADGIVVRQAAAPTGPWTEGKIIASGQTYPSLYGASIHPWSSGTDLYFTVSQWSTYNAYLMRATITPQAVIEPRPAAPAIPLPGGQALPAGPLPDAPMLRLPEVLRPPAPAAGAPTGPGA